MLFPQIDKIKDEYTDKYVVVDGKRPELARFSDLVGQVKTVNMSGRALVEFMDYHLNIGWFDIDLDYLKVVDKPAPKEKDAKKPAAKKAAPKKPAAASGEKKLSPLEMARMQGAGAKPAAKKKSSTADILAAARGGTAAKSEPKAEAPAKPSSGAVDRSKMSVADMLAAARTGKTAAPATESEPEPAAEPEPAPEAAAEAPAGKVDKTTMSIDEMIAYCREKDAE
ncbi:MAG: hypothetical protein GXP26_02305 [Planctomycetes bacterium]|nr:hypothetical protein [Planctomycetota bacterium]